MNFQEVVLGIQLFEEQRRRSLPRCYWVLGGEFWGGWEVDGDGDGERRGGFIVGSGRSGGVGR